MVPQWFTKRRSFANSVATCGSGFGGLIYSLATNAMITNLGLAWAFRILAIMAFVVNGACSLIVRDRNKAVGAIHNPFHKDLFKRFEFWLFIGWGFFSLLGYVIVVFSITDYAQSVGFTASQGSLAAAMFNCTSIASLTCLAIFMSPSADSLLAIPSIARPSQTRHWFSK